MEKRNSSYYKLIFIYKFLLGTSKSQAWDLTSISWWYSNHKRWCSWRWDDEVLSNERIFKQESQRHEIIPRSGSYKIKEGHLNILEKVYPWLAQRN